MTTHKIWNNTPWIIYVRLTNADTMLELCEYCQDAFGEKTESIHDNWNYSGASIDNKMWFSFHTEEHPYVTSWPRTPLIPPQPAMVPEKGIDVFAPEYWLGYEDY